MAWVILDLSPIKCRDLAVEPSERYTLADGRLSIIEGYPLLEGEEPEEDQRLTPTTSASSLTRLDPFFNPTFASSMLVPCLVSARAHGRLLHSHAWIHRRYTFNCSLAPILSKSPYLIRHTADSFQEFWLRLSYQHPARARLLCLPPVCRQHETRHIPICMVHRWAILLRRTLYRECL